MNVISRVGVSDRCPSESRRSDRAAVSLHVGLIVRSSELEPRR
jgi:hypothetical protein